MYGTGARPKSQECSRYDDHNNNTDRDNSSDDDVVVVVVVVVVMVVQMVVTASRSLMLRVWDWRKAEVTRMFKVG